MDSLNRRRLLQLLSTASVASVLPRAGAQERPMPPIPRAPKPAKEVRAIWIHPEQHTDADEKTGKAQIKAQVDRYARANFNLILPWTVSGYLAALEHEEYRKDHPTAKWDWLGYLIEESAKVGIDVDMWYSFTDYRDPKSPEFNPAIGGSPTWMAKRIDELQPNQTVMKLDKRVDNVCPQHFGARAWMQAQLERTITRYPKLHGLHIEEPGYGTKGYCLCDLCSGVFEQLHGRKLIESLETPQAEDFRTLGNSAMIEELRQQLAEKHPSMLLSANGGYDWRHDRVRGRDWGRWGAAGWLRYYVPQVYVNDLARFKRELSVTMEDIGAWCPVYAGMALDSTSGKNTIQNIAQQIEAARELGAPGVALFHGAAFTDEHLEVLRTGVFRKPA
jgi:uncharacterized lipoprotein YddW (UPF0748 family)